MKHAGSIHKATAPGRIYDVLKRARGGAWMSTLEIQEQAGVCAFSAHMVAVKRQLPKRERIRRERTGQVHYYRLVRA